jgi:hypothetical protein
LAKKYTLTQGQIPGNEGVVDFTLQPVSFYENSGS